MKWILDILNLGQLQITTLSNKVKLPSRIHNVGVTVEMLALKYKHPRFSPQKNLFRHYLKCLLTWKHRSPTGPPGFREEESLSMSSCQVSWEFNSFPRGRVFILRGKNYGGKTGPRWKEDLDSCPIFGTVARRLRGRSWRKTDAWLDVE